jgi:hypothetical protein
MNMGPTNTPETDEQGKGMQRFPIVDVVDSGYTTADEIKDTFTNFFQAMDVG